MEVTSNVVQVDTTGAVLGKVENQRMINDLPLGWPRHPCSSACSRLAFLQPDPDDASGNPFSVSGQRSESLTFLLDGANNTDFLGNNIVVSPNPDAVEEFKILTNNYDAAIRPHFRRNRQSDYEIGNQCFPRRRFRVPAQHRLERPRLFSS